MAEVLCLKGNVVDIVNEEGDVVPVDVRELDRYINEESTTPPKAEQPPKQSVAEATGLVALGAYFCGDCLQHVGLRGYGHMRGYHGKGSRGGSRGKRSRRR